MSNVGGDINTLEIQSRNMINICTKYRFDSLIISDCYGGQRYDMTHDRPWTMPGLWHKLLTSEVKKSELDVTAEPVY